jgi:hypothetical protein
MNEPSSLDIPLGEARLVALDENPSTGYLWIASFIPEFLELVDTPPLPAAPSRPFDPMLDAIGGGSSPAGFMLRAMAAGEGVAIFRLARPWAPSDFVEERLVAIRCAP